MDNRRRQTISQFRDEVHVWSEHLLDAKGMTDQMSLDDWKVRFLATNGYEQSLFGGETVVAQECEAKMTDYAIAQMAGSLGIPTRWVRDINQCPRELREMVFNWKYKNSEPKKQLMRMRDYGQTLRAVLSDQYTPFDHRLLVDAVYNAVEMQDMLDDVQVVKSYVGDQMRAYIMFPNVRFDTPDSDRPMGDGGGSGGLHPAVYISNSEIGNGSVRIHGGLFRSYCVNGLIIGWSEQETFKVSHRWSTTQHLALRANEAIAVAMKMSEVAGTRFIECQSLLVEPTNLKGLIDRWGDKYSIGVGKKENWLEALTTQQKEIGQVSYADVINEATYIANRTESVEVTEQLERMAGDMVMAEVYRDNTR